MLKLCDVSKKYKNEYALDHLFLDIEKGKLYLFIGENGSGKSTTIKLISKVIFQNGNKGKIENDFRRIVYLPDHCSYPKLLLVKTYLQMFLNKETDDNMIDFKMKEYNLENKYIGNLSKGMLRKVGLIQILLSEADLYLFDEPQEGLDHDACIMFKHDVKWLINEGKTVIISTHLKTLFKDMKPQIVNFKDGIANVKKQA